jgi:hypothetical protein
MGESVICTIWFRLEKKLLIFQKPLYSKYSFTNWLLQGFFVKNLLFFGYRAIKHFQKKLGSVDFRLAPIERSLSFDIFVYHKTLCPSGKKLRQLNSTNRGLVCLPAQQPLFQ